MFNDYTKVLRENEAVDNGETFAFRSPVNGVTYYGNSPFAPGARCGGRELTADEVAGANVVSFEALLPRIV